MFMASAASAKKPDAVSIVESLKLEPKKQDDEKSKEAPEAAQPGIEAAGEEIIAAVQSGNAIAVMDAIKAAIELCRSED